MHQCFVNKHNLFFQVGLIAVNALGTAALMDRGLQNPGPVTGTSITNKDKKKKTRPTAMDDLAFDMNFDQKTAETLREIEAVKDVCVAAEDYDTAKQLKSVINELKAKGTKLTQLEMGKLRAVEAEDYDRAKHIKVELARVREYFDTRLHEIPGYSGYATTAQRQRLGHEKAFRQAKQNAHVAARARAAPSQPGGVERVQQQQHRRRQPEQRQQQEEEERRKQLHATPAVAFNQQQQQQRQRPGQLGGGGGGGGAFGALPFEERPLASMMGKGNTTGIGAPGSSSAMTSGAASTGVSTNKENGSSHGNGGRSRGGGMSSSSPKKQREREAETRRQEQQEQQQKQQQQSPKKSPFGNRNSKRGNFPGNPGIGAGVGGSQEMGMGGSPFPGSGGGGGSSSGGDAVVQVALAGVDNLARDLPEPEQLTAAVSARSLSTFAYLRFAVGDEEIQSRSSCHQSEHPSPSPFLPLSFRPVPPRPVLSPTRRCCRSLANRSCAASSRRRGNCGPAL